MTDAERARVRRYLGFSDRSQGLFTVLESTISSLSSEGEEDVLNILDELTDIETKLSDARCRLKAARVEDITLNSDEIYALRDEGKRLVRDLSTVLGIRPLRAPFTSADVSGQAGRG